MTAHRMFNLALLTLCVAAWAFVMNADFHEDHDTLAELERREWVQAVQFCHRTAGPQTQPEYTEDNRLVCVGKRDQRHNEVKVATQ